MKTLYKQYIVVTLVVIFASLTLSIFLLGQIYNNQIRVDTDEKNLEIALEVTEIVETMPAERMDEYFQSVAKLGYQIVIVDGNKEITNYGNEFAKTKLNNEMLALVGSNAIYHGIRNYKQKFSIMNHYANDIQNTVGVPFRIDNKNYAMFIRMDNASSFTEMHYLIVGFLLISAIIIFVAMILLARQLVQPLKQLQRATEQIAQENYDIDLKIKRNDELGQLALHFQKMAQRLAENDQLKKDFINNVSHDFQSPLLNIQGYANVLKDADNTEEERVQYLGIIESETKRLSALTKQLLLLSSLDQKNLPIKKQTFSLDQQLKELLFAKRWKLDDKQIELMYELEPIEIYADQHLLEQVWDNLLSNAISYSEVKGKIVVTCSREEHTVVVSIRDYGIGIPKDALERVKERFYRVDTSRSSQGSGLGLAIVTEIVGRHDGELVIESELGKGTNVTVRLLARN
ncbi:sensor histidine kinase [Lysinibacillus antri]|uniref:Heme sensor protein HssS n=1 Tax=Lysinibacillus antri TaxID=2498145 RepID=A0A432LCC4_9BACI|nr:HAMP domain-containing sensor histidine kinase [Lysinibacillus antri]RUL53537.1 HAMP domain-containing histidine kinase [Lysinibacillus antri]